MQLADLPLSLFVANLFALVDAASVATTTISAAAASPVSNTITITNTITNTTITIATNARPLYPSTLSSSKAAARVYFIATKTASSKIAYC